MKVYNSAPLPFMGQKRRFVRDFREVVKKFKDAKVFVDLFGGSGLLSHTVKRQIPESRVVYNDYDGFCRRLENVDKTNEIIRKIRLIVEKLPKDKIVSKEVKNEILEVIRPYEEEGYVDYITIGSSLLFSGKYATSFNDLKKQGFYNVVKQNDYVVEGYLEGLEICHLDYKELYAKYKDIPGVVFLIDPPYLSTEVGSYQCYWRLNDYLDVLKCLESSNYVYFTSAKSQIIELCNWMKNNSDIGDPFNGAEVYTQQNNINMNSSFMDIMLVKGS